MATSSRMSTQYRHAPHAMPSAKYVQAPALTAHPARPVGLMKHSWRAATAVWANAVASSSSRIQITPVSPVTASAPCVMSVLPTAHSATTPILTMSGSAWMTVPMPRSCVTKGVSMSASTAIPTACSAQSRPRMIVCSVPLITDWVIPRARVTVCLAMAKLMITLFVCCAVPIASSAITQTNSAFRACRMAHMNPICTKFNTNAMWTAPMAHTWTPIATSAWIVMATVSSAN